jgi:hypothetical protein
MTITPLPKTGGSSKFLVSVSKRGEFTIALSRTLCSVVWQLDTPDAELQAAKQMAEAIVGRHDPVLPFKDKYIFAEHNSLPTLEAMIKFLHKTQM